MAAVSERRARAIRYGICRGRRDLGKLSNVSYMVALWNSPPTHQNDQLSKRTLAHKRLGLAIGWCYPYAVGFLAPLLITPSGQAWRRTIAGRWRPRGWNLRPPQPRQAAA